MSSNEAMGSSSPKLTKSGDLAVSGTSERDRISSTVPIPSFDTGTCTTPLATRPDLDSSTACDQRIVPFSPRTAAWSGSPSARSYASTYAASDVSRPNTAVDRGLVTRWGSESTLARGVASCTGMDDDRPRGSIAGTVIENGRAHG